MSSLDDAPVSSRAMRSGASGALCPVVSTTMARADEAAPLVPAFERAFAVKMLIPSDRSLSGCSSTDPAEISAADKVVLRTLVDPLNKMMLSPATRAVPEISIPSIATLNVGRSDDVTLSRADIPVSLASVILGAPGVPGTLLSTTTLSCPTDNAEFPRFETRLCKTYVSSLRS